MISINDKNFIFATFNDKVKLTPKMINNNILSNILKVLKIKNEGKCSKHGYIKSNSIEIVSKSFGKIEMQSLHGYVIYDVQFKACVCNPVIGNHIECVVKKINNFGILCTSQINENGSMVDVLDIIIPKHSYSIKSNVDFNDINVDINVIIEIVGKKYQLNKKTISVVGKIIAINTSNKFDNQIDIWGADHGGYIKRVQSALTALSDGKATLDVRLCQMVKLLRDGEPIKMSKRSGNFVTLRDVVEEVGKDVVRFIMLTRKNDASLDFDFARVTEQSKDNPVFYVQYSHARVCSVLRKAAGEFENIDILKADLSLLTDESELQLIKTMTNWPRIVESAALAHEPHRISYYLYELASEFHALWNKGNDRVDLRFIIDDNKEVTLSRLAMITAFSNIIAAGLNILGVEPVTEM